MAGDPKKESAKTEHATKRPAFTTRDAVILAECALHVGRGMESEMQKDPGKRQWVLTSEAREFWIEYHMRSIPQAFEKYGSGANWTKQRGIVTGMAGVLGITAAQYALADPDNKDERVIQVTLEHVERATETIRDDPRCVGAKQGGQGIYCES